MTITLKSPAAEKNGLSLTDVLAPTGAREKEADAPSSIEEQVSKALGTVLNLKEQWVLRELYLKAAQSEGPIDREQLLAQIERRGVTDALDTEAQALRMLSYGAGKRKSSTAQEVIPQLSEFSKN